MSPPSKSVFYPLHSNPHHLAPQTHKITRSAINVSDDEGSEGPATPFERDDEGEQLLLSLLGGQWTDLPSMDVDMDQQPSPSNKRKAGDHEDVQGGGESEEEVFEFRLLSSSKPNKKIALYPPVSTFYVPNPRDAPVSDEQLAAVRAQIEASCVDADWVRAQSRLSVDAPPSHPTTPYHATSSQTKTTPKSSSTLPASTPLPTFLVTSQPRPPSTNFFSRHLSPEPQEERGPGGHLPCVQLGVERVPHITITTASHPPPEWFSQPSSSTSHSTPASKSPKKKKKKTRPPTKKAQQGDASRPMYYLPPAPTPAAPMGLGGKSRGYGWGYGAGREELWGEEARGYVRDRMREGWVGGGRGEGWWGKGGKVWGETQR